MYEELMIAGAGGQGILFIGKIVCLAAMAEEKEVTWFPSYGPAMRGGEATCTVIISSEEIGSPISEHPDSLIVMNRPSLKFVEMVKPGGLVIINKSLVDSSLGREDIEILEIEASNIAQNLGNPQVANLVLLGAYLKRKRIVSFENIKKAIRDESAEKKLTKQLRELNEKALQRGWDLPA